MVLCFGEILLRFEANLKSNSAFTSIGGAELNVAASLAKWNVPTKYISALPNNFISEEIVQLLNKKKINCSQLIYKGNRIGSYYLSQHNDIKSGAVVYDREHSSFANLKLADIDLANIFTNVHWFHITAITPALSENHVGILEALLKKAKEKNITVSIDLNYRNKLWHYTEKPYLFMDVLLPYCQVVMGNIWAVEALLNIPSTIKTSDGKTNEALVNAGKISMQALLNKYTNIHTIAFTYRLSKSYFALIFKNEEYSLTKPMHLNKVVDKVGSGDSFMAGLIYGCIKKWQPQHIINFACGAAISKMQVKGDFNTTAKTKIAQLCK